MARNHCYVDKLFPTVRSENWPFNEACHLMILPGCDVQVLHAFAASLGLRRSWFQTSENGVPHYDLTRNKRFLAVRYGAKEIDRQRVKKIIDGWREIKAAADGAE